MTASLSFLYLAVNWPELPKFASPPDGWKTVTNDEILTISEVAALLKIAEKTVYVLAQRREIPGFKVGGQWRFSRAAIDSWIESRTRAPQDAGRLPGQSEAKRASPGSGAKTRRRRR